MLIVLSPAKRLDYVSSLATSEHSMPQFIPHAARLIEALRKLTPAEIGSLMKISDPLAAQNHQRYAAWSTDFHAGNSRQAVLAFNGDVYEGLDAGSLGTGALVHLQSRVRILSGLYGLLRPLDLMQAYRLEMGTRLKTARGSTLYDYWGELITERLNQDLEQARAKALVNLASEEYFKAVRPKLLRVPVITPVFEDGGNDRYKVISFHAKRARGLMARHAALNGSTSPEELKAFALEGYAFAEEASDAGRWVFRRRRPQHRQSMLQAA
jgi:cytoplasmic iron level regulating protein YaaA (DUF328/UPF0246 family)